MVAAAIGADQSPKPNNHATARYREILFSHTLAYQCHPPGFAAWSTPEWAIVSGGFNDRLPAVEAAYRAEGGEVLHTATSGEVQVSVVAGALSVDTWRNSR